jgi:hypothetical protein
MACGEGRDTWLIFTSPAAISRASNLIWIKDGRATVSSNGEK